MPIAARGRTMLGFKIGAQRADKEKKPAQQPRSDPRQHASQGDMKPRPGMLGSGAAANAARALRRRTAQIDEAAGYANGGVVRGPGTGVSDDIETIAPEGGYIMPADSTEQIGAGNLAGMGQPVPVNLSDGEYQMPPEQVHAIGVQALDGMKDATHTPADEQGQGFGFQPGGAPQDAAEPPLFFRDGGEVRRPDYFTDRTGRTTSHLPSQSRAVVPYQAPGGPMATTQQPASAQSRAVVPYQAPQPAQPASTANPAQQDLYRARAETMARAKGDTASFERQRAAQDARFAAAAQNTPAAGPGRARSFVNKAGPGGAALAAVPALLNARDEDSTARYAQRFGMNEPTGDGSAGDIAKFAALRGLGFASDVGSTMTFGLADKLYRDKNQVDTAMLGTGVGGVTGGVAGGKTGELVGRGFDAAARALSRGRYTGNVGARWGRGLGAGAGAVGGAMVGANIAGASVSPDEAPAGRDPATQDPGTVTPNSTAPAAAPTSDAPPVLDNDVKRVGNSFSGTNIREGFTINGQPVYGPGAPPRAPRSPQNEAAVQALLARTPEFGEMGSAPPAPQAAGFQPQGAGGSDFVVIPDLTRTDPVRQALVRGATRALPGSQNGQLTARQLETMRGLLSDESRDATARQTSAQSNATRMAEAIMRETGADRRTAMQMIRDDARLQLDQRRLTGEEEARGFQTRAGQRLEALEQRYEQAAPDERSAIAEQIRVLRGKDQPARFAVAAGGQMLDPQTQQLITQPAQVFNTQTGEFVGQQNALPPIAENPAVQRIMQNTSLSREERAKQIRALGYQ